MQTQLIQDTSIVPEATYQTLAKAEQADRKPISEAVVKTLCAQLVKEENAQVKEVIVAAIGGIGMPEAAVCIDHLVKHLRKQPNQKAAPWADQPQIKCMAIWALGRLPSRQTIRKAHDVLINALQDPYFKVRAAACTAIAQIGA